jgi:glycosyltransferase involved in cell wall biosynthesis
MNKLNAQSQSAVERDSEADEEGSELLTVIVPCLNEQKNVRATAQSVFELAPELSVDVEILFVDDGSTDDTLEVMRDIADGRPECRIMVNSQNRGLGRSAMKAYQRIDPDSWATILPGDNEFIFESIWNFLEVRDDYDLLVGYLNNTVIRPLFRRVASKTFTELINFLYGFSYRHLNGMKMYRVSCFRGLDIESSGHAFNAELIAKALLRDPTIRIGQVPYLARGRAHGQTKALQPSSVVQAIREVYEGKRSVQKYRQRVIEEQDREA